MNSCSECHRRFSKRHEEKCRSHPEPHYVKKQFAVRILIIMKRLFFVLLSIFLACAVSPLSAQEIKPRGQHPRLFFTPI
jgi:hypothetical protein